VLPTTVLYDKDGREISPMTLADMRGLGARSVEATCAQCAHEAAVNVDALLADVPVPDVSLRLRGTACDSRRILVRLNIGEVYAAHRAQFG